MKTNIEIPTYHREKPGIDYMLILMLVLYALIVILQSVN
jgi:hypothetical protein